MSLEKTLSIIKPDAVKRDLTGKIIAMFEEKGLRVVAQKKIWLSKEQAGCFYAVHRKRPFFDELCEFMSSGPIVVQVLQGNNAIELNRRIMGATNPEEADAGTIRKEFAVSMTENSAHGSDSAETAREEINFFFSGLEIVQF
jgi:nucleoside-diphosphate kinase